LQLQSQLANIYNLIDYNYFLNYPSLLVSKGVCLSLASVSALLGGTKVGLNSTAQQSRLTFGAPEASCFVRFLVLTHVVM